MQSLPIDRYTVSGERTWLTFRLMSRFHDMSEEALKRSCFEHVCERNCRCHRCVCNGKVKGAPLKGGRLCETESSQRAHRTSLSLS